MEMNKFEAIGVVEARYFTTAINVIDIMCKECEVELLNVEKYLGGRLTSVIVGGNISSVNQAIDAVKMRFGQDLSILKNALVITRPHKEILKFIVKSEEEVKTEVLLEKEDKKIEKDEVCIDMLQKECIEESAQEKALEENKTLDETTKNVESKPKTSTRVSTTRRTRKK